ncbi:MAG TPA: hypothetical protein VMC07_02725, partial [Candidatus Omnitrophota bacterium]|nr:hypothetical protein [Candidatus Omnitrophota bacterium]
MKINLKWGWKIWLMTILLVISLFLIFYTPYLFQNGVLISSVTTNSTASFAGFKANTLINSINGQEVNNLQDYSNLIQSIYPSNLTGEIKVTFSTNNGNIIYYSNESPQIVVKDRDLTNLKTGLDLSGGARALVQAENHSLTSQEVNDLVSIVSNRFNVYGISDINIRSVSDLVGNNFMLIEIAGATPNDLQDLISQQGKFEGRIGNETVFIGGNQDIESVATSGQDAGIYSCNPTTGGYVCQFRFTIYLSQNAAERQAAATANLGLSTNSSQYLSKPLDLYIDGSLQESLQISTSLKGRVTTQVSIEGSGSGTTQQDAYDSALAD